MLSSIIVNSLLVTFAVVECQTDPPTTAIQVYRGWVADTNVQITVVLTNVDDPSDPRQRRARVSVVSPNTDEETLVNYGDIPMEPTENPGEFRLAWRSEALRVAREHIRSWRVPNLLWDDLRDVVYFRFRNSALTTVTLVLGGIPRFLQLVHPGFEASVAYCGSRK
ncbi:hypothetical protein FOL47_011177 [Perkinsus chesapeaki]|uniref:Uncharacterized protein n=1 Tax=Perkinsus chesapeaki TaxID=330153 RepID=A0A7J6KY71_PERCH|nr:hypothetical protein FOL47_011177 [Perkinsus chesapeaki]